MLIVSKRSANNNFEQKSIHTESVAYQNRLFPALNVFRKNKFQYKNAQALNNKDSALSFHLISNPHLKKRTKYISNQNFLKVEEQINCFRLENAIKIGKNIFRKKKSLSESFDYQILRRGNRVLVFQQPLKKQFETSVSELKTCKSELNKKLPFKRQTELKKITRILKPLAQLQQIQESGLYPWNDQKESRFCDNI